MIAVRGPIRVVAALVAGLLVALLAPATSADAAPPSVVEVQTYSYDDVAVPVLSDTRVAERGSPIASYDDTTYNAADRGSSGASLRSGDTTTPANHTYDDPARFVRGASGSRNIEGASSGAEASSFAFDCSRVAANGGSRLAEASSSAFRAADRVGDWTISAKHLPGAGGRWNKWAEGVDINGSVANALRSEGASFLPNAGTAADRFIVRTNMGSVVGTRGETFVKVVVSNDGRIITAYPVK